MKKAMSKPNVEAKHSHRNSTLNPMAAEWKMPKSNIQNPELIPVQPGYNFEVQQKMIDILSMPKTSLKQFDGNPIEFWSFMHCFDSVVGSTTVNDDVKLNRLLENCIGRAARVIQCCTFMNATEGYYKARELLASRFGNEYQISEAWIKKTLRAMKMIGEIDTRLRMVKIVNRLPLYIQGRWRQNAVKCLEMSGRYSNITSFVDFLERIAREVNDPVFGYLPDRAKHNKKDSSQTQVKTKPQLCTEKSDKNGKCYLCTKDHLLNKCDRFQAMNPKQKLETLKQNRLCFNCMESRQASKWCKANGCACGKNHAQVLHDVFVPPQREEEDEKSCHVSVLMSKAGAVSLPIVPVIVKSGQKQLSTHALLDPGSTRSFCDKVLCDSLETKGNGIELNIETLNKQSVTMAHEVSLEVAGKGKSKYVTLNKVIALEKFPKMKNCEINVDIDRWKHLEGLLMPQNVNVQLLIGQDHPRALLPLEVRQGGDREPYAVRTVLGWAINGPTTGIESNLSDIATVCNFVNIKENLDVNLEMQVERFWKIDVTPDVDSVMSVDDKRVLKEWNDKLKLIDAHYQLPIPIVCPVESLQLPNNRD